MIVIAGEDCTKSNNSLSVVSCFNLARNIWSSKLRSLNEARGNPSACSIQGHVFVFGGWNGGRAINTIEKISQVDLKPDSAIPWQLINVPPNVFPARQNPAVAPLNDTEIVILGGYLGDNRYLSDVVVFDTTTSQCRQVLSNGRKKKFNSWSN